MKKSAAIVIALLLIVFVNPVSGASDTTKPTFKNFKMSSTNVTVGDTITFSLEIYDTESGVSNGVFAYRNDTGTFDDIIFLELNAETGLYEGKITIDEFFLNGTWTIYEIQAIDNAANNNRVEVNYEFVVTGAYEPDKVKPTWKNLTITNTNVEPGDYVHVSVEIYDDQSGPAHGAISWRNKTGTFDDLLFLNLNPETGLYENSILIEDMMQNGVWTFYNLQVSDNEGNNRSEKLSGYTFTISGGVADVTPPTWKNLVSSAKNVKPGDTINFSVDVFDTESKPQDASLTVYDPLGREVELVFLKNKNGSQTFEGQWKISLNDMVGTWKIGRIQVSDTYGNVRRSKVDHVPFTVSSIFEYGLNTVIKGESFNPLQGVKAVSPYEGNLTDSIKYSGKVDTPTVGFYLIKYEVRGKDGNVYDDYRWIKVVPAEAESLLFNEDVKISAATANSLSITKDGEAYKLASDGMIEEEGSYKVSFKNTSTLYHWNQPVLNTGDDSLLSSKTRGNTFSFTIDKTPPLVSGIEEQGEYEHATITYDEGSATLNGQAIDNEYKVTKPGEYVLVVTDKALNKTEVNFMIRYPLSTILDLRVQKLTSTYAMLAWSVIEDADEYEIFRKEANQDEFELIDTSSETEYKDDTLLVDVSYEYSVRATRREGENKVTSEMSESLQITLKEDFTIYYIGAAIIGLIALGYYYIKTKANKKIANKA